MSGLAEYAPLHPYIVASGEPPALTIWAVCKTRKAALRKRKTLAGVYWPLLRVYAGPAGALVDVTDKEAEPRMQGGGIVIEHDWKLP